MNPYILLPLAGLLMIGIGFLLGWTIKKARIRDFVAEAKLDAERILENARLEGENLKKEKLIEAQDELHRLQQKKETEWRNKRADLSSLEEKLNNRDVQLNRREELVARKDSTLEGLAVELQDREHTLRNKETRLGRLVDEQNSKLEQIAGLSRAEARQQLLDNLLATVRKEAAQTLNEIVEEARQSAHLKAKETVVAAIQQSAADHSVETTVSIVTLPSDDMKGRIIGREGRNIRAFEMTTGIDVIVDDTPEVVILSGFDPIRREIAKLSLEKLIADGRIHPARIEDVVNKTREEFDDILLETGEAVLMDLSLSGFADDLVRLFGRMKYFTSYGQNLLQHSVEVARLASLIAAELELDSNLAKRAGFLHDIGKVVQGRFDENHTDIGRELLRKHKESQTIIDAISEHHAEGKAIALLSAIVHAANAISMSRPGARKDSLEGFIRRQRKLEDIALSFDGVDRVFAVQAGREVRVMVDFEKVNDAMSQQLAHDIAKKLEKDLDYPGQIKIMLIREFRAAGIAK
jgi:ribonuclease Y